MALSTYSIRVQSSFLLQRESTTSGQDGYRNMVCIESGNALDNTLSLAPGAEHMLTVDYELETLAG